MEQEKSAAYLQIRNINKWYPGDVHAVADMNMEIRQGEFLVFVGPSGCGKTTLLRTIAGLESITEGEIFLNGTLLNRLPPKNRDIAMVFQNYALYPNMKVRENIAFPLKMRKIPKQERGAQIQQVAEKLELERLLERKPSALSGGQRQRVALARAMVRKPQLFLMDEPLSNLDAKLRTEMRREIVALQKSLGVTTIYVTHDQTEAMTMGDRIAVMRDGFLQQIGTPREIYEQPANLFVAGFVGSPSMNTWDSSLIREGEGLTFTFGDKRLPLPPGAQPKPQWGSRLKAAIRPEDVLEAEGDRGDAFWMEIQSVEHTGRETVVFLTAAGRPNLSMITSAKFSGKVGQTIPLRLRENALLWFHPETEERLL